MWKTIKWYIGVDLKQHLHLHFIYLISLILGIKSTKPMEIALEFVSKHIKGHIPTDTPNSSINLPKLAQLDYKNELTPIIAWLVTKISVLGV